MYFDDLTELSYHSRFVRSGLKNVGWLDDQHPFPTSEPAEDFVDALWRYCSSHASAPRMRSRMGMTRCPTHGLAHMITCCVHVADAVDAGTLEESHVVLDDWVTPSIVCARCKRLVDAAERNPDEPQIGFDHVLDSPLVPYCHECLRDWFAATGQGDLSEIISRARAPHLK